MSVLIFMYLYDSKKPGVSNIKEVKGLTQIDVQLSPNFIEKLKGIALPIFLVHYRGVTKKYDYTNENLNLIVHKINELFEV